MWRSCVVRPKQGVLHLHGHNLAHGDLKPANVLMTAGGQLMLSDWGMSHVVTGLTTVGQAASVVGYTPGYAAPEVLEGLRCTLAADIFSLGTIFANAAAACRKHAVVDAGGDATLRRVEELARKMCVAEPQAR